MKNLNLSIKLVAGLNDEMSQLGGNFRFISKQKDPGGSTIVINYCEKVVMSLVSSLCISSPNIGVYVEAQEDYWFRDAKRKRQSSKLGSRAIITNSLFNKTRNKNIRLSNKFVFMK